ncbi:MAG: cupin domain-containing protein [Chloroflexi bacterium]|nr:cupin domain-containing protein [Chloroflexota bacterium]MDA1003220.1 cupin domain-containing protein [Chloroflexota bacterium]
MPAYRLHADNAGRTHIAPLALLDRPWENGPGDFKGVGGSVLGDASRVMLMRFETGAHPSFHRAAPGFLVVLEGELVVNASDGDEVVLAPGDAIRVETTGQGGWRLGNRADGYALVALTQMPPKASTA